MRSRGLIICISGLIFSILQSGCRKDDADKVTKEIFSNVLCREVNADSLESYALWLQNMGTRFAPAVNHRNVGFSIRDRFINSGYQNTKIDSFEVIKSITVNDSVIEYRGWHYNVVATLMGKANDDSVCIVGAHYDDTKKKGDPFIYAPGANDNASGVAAILEIARVMRKFKYIPEHSIEFIAFDAEEQGLYGSHAYSQKALIANKPVKYMLNNDMIAYEPANDASGWRVNILDYDNSHSLRINAEQLCKKYTLLMPYNYNKSNKQSDSYPFSINGYKALFFFSDIIDPDYHSDLDLVSHCNFQYCKEIVRLNCAVLVNIN